MKNFAAAGDSVVVTAPYAVIPGDGMLIGSLFCVATKTAALNESTDAVTEGQFDLTAVNAETAAAGAVAYWDAANRRVSVSTGTAIGIFVGGKVAGTTARVRLQAAAGGIALSADGNYLIAPDGRLFALSELSTPATITASGLIITGACVYRGLNVRAVSGTVNLVVYDALSATGTPIHTENAVTLGGKPWMGAGSNDRRQNTTGLYVTLSGGGTATVDVLGD